MTDRSDLPNIQVNRALLGSGVVLISVAALLGTMGGVAMTIAVVGAARSWVRQRDEPPSVTARRRLAQARAAAAAGAREWRQANGQVLGAESAGRSAGIDDG